MLSYVSPRATVQQLLVSHPREVAAVTNLHVQTVLHHLAVCRTAALGYHLYRCEDETCGHQHYQYHSCRDRHCPQCGALKKQAWTQGPHP
jgi:hypothetical protein